MLQRKNNQTNVLGFFEILTGSTFIRFGNFDQFAEGYLEGYLRPRASKLAENIKKSNFEIRVSGFLKVLTESGSTRAYLFFGRCRELMKK